MMESSMQDQNTSAHRKTDKNQRNLTFPTPSDAQICPHCTHCRLLIQTKEKSISNASFLQHQDQVILKFNTKEMIISNNLSEELKLESFDNWSFQEHQLLHLLCHMFQQLNLLTTFNIQRNRLYNWLEVVYRTYRQVSFHNFHHAFCVTQMTYALIHRLELTERLTPLHHFILIFSALCHDLDHPGLNNTYQMNARTDLSLLYNDQSPLENHHCSTAFKLLSDCNITENFDQKQYSVFREGVIQCILATDLAKHDEILERFLKIIPNFNFSVDLHTKLLMMIIIKTADISNEVRPESCAKKWMNLLFQEYFQQSDLEKSSDLPVAPYMDKNLVDKNQSQVYFIQSFLCPLLTSLTHISPNTQEIINAVDLNLTTYRHNK